MLILYLRLMRLPQWIKNLILFAGLIFSKKVFELDALGKVSLAFFFFSLVASSQYVFNDFLDREEDAKHPEKKHRPIASGELDVGIALAITGIILPFALIGSYLLSVPFFFLTIFYLGFNIIYSKVLKHIVILDVMSISIGFVLRAIAGALVIGVQFSNWLLLCTFMLALFWGFSKRRGEISILKDQAGKHRKILQEYSIEFLDLMMAIVATLTLVSYVMYTVSPTTAKSLGTEHMVYTVPIVVYAIFRSLYIIYIKNMGHDPTRAILTDKAVLVSGVLWLLLVLSLMFGNFSGLVPVL
ncbi:phosphoribose diphosphate:decaprenyl-phosphate phosphoribosyltransferase [Leptospira ryugenii]|uniref:Phosphoribose diphosphate:decaprenyl-phosphate phosphoribosyltransferase n=1 Tax=Leptospira ryugenii TaxID=1917863 RepID=A0A2P2DVC8_9LEPT|nr:decaprenyl-phosphate phosphoribosyltransferase [Leptospira ryugenii]GBF48601.1 phosphoribose diphosphate:decaprenyl-phosphate phosphoribosyltransferase [Leptospira ryugenii]